MEAQIERAIAAAGDQEQPSASPTAHQELAHGADGLLVFGSPLRMSLAPSMRTSAPQSHRDAHDDDSLLRDESQVEDQPPQVMHVPTIFIVQQQSFIMRLDVSR